MPGGCARQPVGPRTGTRPQASLRMTNSWCRWTLPHTPCVLLLCPLTGRAQGPERPTPPGLEGRARHSRTHSLTAASGLRPREGLVTTRLFPHRHWKQWGLWSLPVHPERCHPTRHRAPSCTSATSEPHHPPLGSPPPSWCRENEGKTRGHTLWGVWPGLSRETTDGGHTTDEQVGTQESCTLHSWLLQPWKILVAQGHLCLQAWGEPSVYPVYRLKCSPHQKQPPRHPAHVAQPGCHVPFTMGPWGARGCGGGVLRHPTRHAHIPALAHGLGTGRSPSLCYSRTGQALDHPSWS